MKRAATHPISRFWNRVKKTDSCWLWMGALNNKGYGSISCKGGVLKLVHRFAYEALKGQIPDGLTIDHLCRVRNCVNPNHLEAVTFKENLLRGNSPSSVHARKIACVKGHPYDRIDKDGARRCGPCNREWQRNNNKKKREEKTA